MKEFFANIAWTMEKPAFGGAWHLCFLIFGLIACVVGAWLLRKTTDKQAKWIVFACGVALLLFETCDQLFWFFYLGDGVHYQWWLFPFQLCDAPIYLCLIFAFMKDNPVKRAVYNCLATYNLFGGFVSIIERSGLSFEYVILSVNGYTSHLLLVFLGMYLVASGRACKGWKDWFLGMAAFFTLCSLAQILNVIFQDKPTFLFYISPYLSTPLAVFHDIEASIGWFGNMCLYLLALSIAAVIMFLVGMYGRKPYRLLAEKIKAKINGRNGKGRGDEGAEGTERQKAEK